MSTKSSSAVPSRTAARLSVNSAKQAPSLARSAKSGSESHKNDGSLTPTETRSEVSFSALGVDAKAMQLQTQLRILEVMKKKNSRRDDSSVDGEDLGSRNLDENAISKLNSMGSEVPEIKDHLKDELDDWASDTAEDNRQSKFRVTSAAAFLNKKKHLYHKSFVDKQFAALMADDAAAASDYASDNDAGSVKDEGGYFSDSATMSGLSRSRIVPNVVTRTDLNPAAYDVQFRPAQEIVDEIERSERVRGHFSVPLAPFDDDDDEVVLTTVQTKPRSSAKKSTSKDSKTPLRPTPQAAVKAKSSATKASPAAPAPKSPAKPDNDDGDVEYDDDDDEGSVIVLSAKALLEKHKSKHQQSRPKTPRSARKPKANVNPNLPDESF